LTAADPRLLMQMTATRGTFVALHGGRAVLIAAGKAASPMTSAFFRWVPFVLVGGVVSGPRETGASLPSEVECWEGGHPFPNEESVEAGKRALALCGKADRDTTLVVLLSGGASSMLALPAGGVTLADKAETSRALMNAGAPIDELNCVRKHLSAIKGGRLGAGVYRSLTLAISDVHGPFADDPSVIGSGPTVADPSRFADALEILDNRKVVVPPSVRTHLERGANGQEKETIKPGDPRLSHATFEVIGNRRSALNGAQLAAAAAGYAVEVIEEPTHGESREASHRFVTEARQRAAAGPRPLCVLAAGETTVRVTGKGLGGRNQEFALAAAGAVGSVGRAALLASIGTDGMDGPTDAAGAVVDSTTMLRAGRAGLEAQSLLRNNDAYRFFDPLGDLIRLGRTGTNVGDLHVMLIA
jgi:glycerate 2-kinase